MVGGFIQDGVHADAIGFTQQIFEAFDPPAGYRRLSPRFEKLAVSDDIVFELHGNMRWAKCFECGRRFAFDEIVARLGEGVDIPDCPQCRGMLKPDVVMFGEQLPHRVLEEASRRAMASDLCIVVGSTLVVYPAAYMPIYAVESGAKLIIINLGATPMDQQAAVLIPAKAGETMSKIIEKVKGKAGI